MQWIKYPYVRTVFKYWILFQDSFISGLEIWIHMFTLKHRYEISFGGS